jgi:hypothetical protein
MGVAITMTHGLRHALGHEVYLKRVTGAVAQNLGELEVHARSVEDMDALWGSRAMDATVRCRLPIQDQIDALAAYPYDRNQQLSVVVDSAS